MNWKTPKKSTIQNIAFIVIIALLLFPPIGTFVKVQLNRLIAFSPKTIAVTDQKMLSSYQWKLVDATGKIVNLQEYKGKIIFINFWATWCPPCIAEMPSMQKLYTDYQDKIVFLFVTNDSFEKANAFLTKENLTLPVYQSLTNSPVEMESSTIPATYLIDQSGNVIVAKIGTANWNSDSFREKLDELLKN
ncbi:thiol-disulfide isomerase/thioredoxin [Flavobacterium sp. CG_23.5]|uniref:TlpA family protein disulfide reductase n=1 Tax=unclassified Flavobacterium TaxID=196869 RepID=UPI0018C9304D|nr:MULTISPECIES: TlpA disulfide reductase family protein [unclassified Flavobacterium]MBG6110996.1 thiol-disulfide isomerase/thioredoxin [Flavobacterium sp. CG_9.10]MBP2282444.1 thiol-disulfide isomerase/thioredoxin [Flavobacterium sp. CG_23.5]